MTEPHTTEEALAEFSKRPLGDIKVLMIEDDALISELVLTHLSEQGCIPYSGATGEDALALATQFKPNVIILDLMLPGLSGEEVLAQLKSNDELKHIPVIVFSNKSEPEKINEMLALGAAEYLVKASTQIASIPSVIKRVTQHTA